MIDLHYWPTPNGWKVTILLEELGLPYRIVPVDIGRGAQFKPEFLEISPNNRMPAIVDHEPAGGGAPIAIFESGAILLYIAEKAGRFIPSDVRGRYEVVQWVMWQMGGLGPMSGQAHHFGHYAPDKIPYAVDRYVNEVRRLYGVMERRLADRQFLAGDYSIADMASYPWVTAHGRLDQNLDEWPSMKRWFEAMAARPAVAKGMGAGAELRTETMDAEAKKWLFGHKPQE